VSDPLTFDWRNVLLVLALPTLGFLLVLCRHPRRPSEPLFTGLAAADAAKAWEVCRHNFRYLSVPKQQSLWKDLPDIAAGARWEHHAVYQAACQAAESPAGGTGGAAAPSNANALHRPRHDFAWATTNFLSDLVQDVLSDAELVEFRAQAYGVVIGLLEVFRDVSGERQARWRQPQRN
jgi:hypothetical protein